MARKQTAIYKASRGTLLPSPRKRSFPASIWLIVGLGGFLVGREIGARLAARGKAVG